MIVSCLQVMKSNTGYYLGHAWLEDDMVEDEKADTEFDGMPYSRNTDYFGSAETAKEFLDYCNLEYYSE